MSGGKHFDCFCANRNVVIIEMNLAFTLYVASSAPVAQSASQRTALSRSVISLDTAKLPLRPKSAGVTPLFDAEYLRNGTR